MGTHEDRIPIVEEHLEVSKRQVLTGVVQVRTETTFVEERAQVDLASEEVEVTRVAVNREVAEPPQVRTEDDVTIVPVLEEVLVVEKRLVLKEELHIRRRVATTQQEVPVTLRKQRAVVERYHNKPNQEDHSR